MTDPAERALDYARHELMTAGNPSWTAVAVLPDRHCRMGALIVATARAAEGAAGALSAALPEAAVMIVGCEQDGDNLRYTVLQPGGRRLIQRNEVREQPIGEPTML